MRVDQDRLHAIAHLYRGNPDVAWLIATINDLAPPDVVPNWCSHHESPEDGPTLVCRLTDGHPGPHQCVVIPRPETALRARTQRSDTHEWGMPIAPQNAS